MSGLAVISHSVGAGVFAVVSLLLLNHRPTRNFVPLLIFACLASFVWASLSAMYAADLLNVYPVVAVSELIRNGFWCLCLVRLLKIILPHKLQGWAANPAFLPMLGVLILALFIDSLFVHSGWEPGHSGVFAKLLFVGHLTFCIVGLALVEHLYRASLPERRWGIKFLCIGLGCMFCYDFYMFANAVLFNGINPHMWNVRGAIAAIVAPLIGLSALRNQKWKTQIGISKKVVLRSSAFIICGVYLLCMASAAYFMRHLGGSFGQALQILFLFGAILALSLMLFSGRVRSFASQQFARHFFKERYDYREKWGKISELLSHTDNYLNLKQRTIKLLADLVDSPKGVLFEWQDNKGYTLKASWNYRVDKRYRLAKNHLTDYLQGCKKAVLIADLKENDKTRALADPLFDSVLAKSAWLIVPLFHGETLQAIVILAKPLTKIEVNTEVLDILCMAGRQATVSLVQENQAKALTQAKQFEAFNKLSAFLIHDLKNIVAQLTLVTANKKVHGKNPKFIASAFNTVENAGIKIERLLNQIRSGDISSNYENINLRRALMEAVHLCSHKMPKPQLKMEVDQQIIILGDKTQFVHIFAHLIENAQQASQPNGSISLEVTIDQPKVEIVLRDNGCGMEQEFIDNGLFLPFVSTKGKKGMGIGVFQAREYIEATKGSLEVESTRGEGTCFTISFPIKDLIVQSEVFEVN